MLNQKKMAGIFGAMLIALSSLSAGSVKPNGCDGATLCPSFPIATRCADCCYTWHVDIGLLYQQPGFADMSPGYAYQPVFQNPTSTSTNSFVDQTVVMLEKSYDYSAGITASLGHLLNHDNWFMGATFDWLHGNISKSVFAASNTLYRPSSEWANQAYVLSNFAAETGTFGRVLYSANTNIYNFKAFLSRGAYISDRFSLDAFGGVKAIWFDNSQYKTYQQPSAGADTTAKYYLNNFQNNWGVGPVFGLNLMYNITKGLSIFSDNNVGALYGQMDYTTVTFVTKGGEVSSDRKVVDSGRLDAVAYLPVRSTIGVMLSKYYLDGNHFFGIKIGYDMQVVVSPNAKGRLTSMTQSPQNNDFKTFVQFKNLNNGYFMSGLLIDFVWDF